MSNTYDEFLAWEISTRAIDFKLVYVDMAGGDHLAGLVLSEIVFWTLPNKNGVSKLRVFHDGEYWIAAPYKEWWERLRLTESQAERAIKILVEKNIVVKSVYKFIGVPALHVRLNTSVFSQKWKEAILALQKDKSCTDNVQSLPEQKSTSVETEKDFCSSRSPLTESTTETTRTLAPAEQKILDEKLLSEEPTTENASEWFLAQERTRKSESQAQPPRSAEEARERTKKALDDFKNASKTKNTEIAAFITSLAESIRPIAEVFCNQFGRVPIGKEKGYWISAWMTQVMIGIDPIDIVTAFGKMRKEGLTIKSPESVTAIAEESMRSRRKSSGESSNGLLSPVTGVVIRSSGSKAKINPFG